MSEWVKREWMGLLGPTRVFEGYGVSEGFYFTTIRGDEWLLHPKSVGKATFCDIKILDEGGAPTAPGVVGMVYGRSHAPVSTFYYLGGPEVKTTADGFMTVGDLAWMDDDEYIFSADRRVDMIIRGGQNVYPAEIEHRLSEHSQVIDCVVIGIRDADVGTRIHAIVQPTDLAYPPTADELRQFVASSLARYRVPATFEFVASLRRDDAGKVRRRELVRDPPTGH